MATVFVSELPRKDENGRTPTETLRDITQAEALPVIKKEKIPDVLSITCEAVNNGLIHGSDVVVTVNQDHDFLKVKVINSEGLGSQDLDCVRHDDNPGDVGLDSCHGRGFAIMRALLRSLGGTVRTSKKDKLRITTIEIPVDETKAKLKPTG